jgi:hypothetical protein
MQSTWIEERNVTANGATALHAPAAGKRWVLLGYSVVINTLNTTAGGSSGVLQDSSTTIAALFAIGATVPNNLSWSVDLGEGIVSAADDNVLNVNLSAAITASSIRITAWGYEV